MHVNRIICTSLKAKMWMMFPHILVSSYSNFVLSYLGNYVHKLQSCYNKSSWNCLPNLLSKSFHAITLLLKPFHVSYFGVVNNNNNNKYRDMRTFKVECIYMHVGRNNKALISYLLSNSCHNTLCMHIGKHFSYVRTGPPSSRTLRRKNKAHLSTWNEKVSRLDVWSASCHTLAELPTTHLVSLK